MLRALVRLLADAAFVAVVMFVSAGTVAWWRAWVLIAVLLVVRVATAIVVRRVHPALIEERAKPPIHIDQPWSDQLLVLTVIATGFLGLPIVAARDVFHWHVRPRPAPLIADIGLVLFILGWVIKGLALHANAFAIATVRLQRERQHAVAVGGVYKVVRHPFYAGTVLVLTGLSFWLESYVAVLLAVVPITFMVIRLTLEERFLQRELPNYGEYVVRVPHRLIPGIW